MIDTHPFVRLSLRALPLSALVPRAGLEPARPRLRTQDFKSCASTNSATPADANPRSPTRLRRTVLNGRIRDQRRRSDSNRCIEVLQTSPLATWVRRRAARRVNKTPPPGGMEGGGAVFTSACKEKSPRCDYREPPCPATPGQSGKRDSNPRHQPWQGCALPTELFPHYGAKDTNTPPHVQGAL